VYIEPEAIAWRRDMAAAARFGGSDRAASIAHLGFRGPPAHRRSVRGSFLTVARPAGVPASAEQLRGFSSALSIKLPFTKVH